MGAVISSTEQHEFRTFPARLLGDEPDAATRGWLEADVIGFLGHKPTPAHLRAMAGYLVSDGQTLAGVYDLEGPEQALHGDIPVATFASFEQPLTVSPGVQLAAHLISSITVRATHRRQGILRRMMTDDLTRAKEAGYAVAALTASEATIYRRFGFGAASYVHDIAVTTDSRFALTSTPSGRCELVDPGSIPALAPAVFERFHRSQPGSIGRHSQYGDRVSGRLTEEGDEDRGRRAAVHYDEAGTVDGYVTYRFAGWESKPHTIAVNDLVAATPDAYLALWEFLASIDLSTRVTFTSASPDDVLRYALVDPRVVQVTDIEDRIWLRILDPIAAFQARHYRADGSVTFRVSDELGFAEGSYRLTTKSGDGIVERLGDESAVDLHLDAWVLAALYLGGTDPRVTAAARVLVEHTPGAASTMAELLAPSATVYANTYF